MEFLVDYVCKNDRCSRCKLKAEEYAKNYFIQGHKKLTWLRKEGKSESYLWPSLTITIFLDSTLKDNHDHPGLGHYYQTLIICKTLFSRGHQLGYIHETLF